MITKFKLFERLYWGRIGAGILPLCVSTGKILLNYRSKDVKEPHTYNLYGGKIDEEFGETENDVADVAKREFFEETGYNGKIQLIKAYVYKDDNFTYHNFIGLIPEEFIPELNWESEGYKWLTLDEFLKIKRKHFGLIKLIQEDLELIKKYAK